MSITVHSGSILESEADCIVNPANSFLRHGGGLAAIIDREAQTWKGESYVSTGIAKAPEGYERNPNIERIWQYKHDHKTAPLLATGNVHVTSAGMLPFKGIVHAVGPIWNGGHFFERALLRDAYANSCAAAHEQGWTSIAFPAISCGIFGFPVGEATLIAANAVSFWATPQPDGIDMAVEFWPFGFEDEFKAAIR